MIFHCTKDQKKLMNGLSLISSASTDQLSDRDFLINLLRQVGLGFHPHFAPRETIGHEWNHSYGYDAKYMNQEVNQGMHQTISEFSDLLIHLSKINIVSLLEIGTAGGYTFAVLNAYLRRFHDIKKSVTTDIDFSSLQIAPLLRHCDVEIVHRSNLEVKEYDFVMIDGEHTFNAANYDYFEFGVRSKVCAFHDIIEGKVYKFWRSLQVQFPEYRYFEFIDQQHRLRGIGVVERF